MSDHRVTLHVGAMKTGTTYVQRMLGGNQEILTQSGITYPQPWSDQVEAVRDVLKMKGGSHLGSIDGCWDRMVERIQASSGDRAILSVEFLSFADRDQARKIVDDLGRGDLDVVIGARDLARVLPAQWQTAVRNGRSSTYREYINGVTGEGDAPAKRHFWMRQDIGQIATTWAEFVGNERVTIVTVPPPGADGGELWRRMAQAMELDAVDLVDKSPSNESLGSTATELLRRINLQADTVGMSTWAYQHGVNRALSHAILPNIPDPNPRLRVPNSVHDWVRNQTERLINEIEASGVRIVGSLDDLRPDLDENAPFVWPEDLTEEDLLTVAIASLTAFADDAATAKRRRIKSDERGQGSGPKGGRRRQRDDT